MVNLQTFPQLGAFKGEVGPGTSPGGIGGVWPMNLPLNYWWNYGTKRKRINRKRSGSGRKRINRKRSGSGSGRKRINRRSGRKRINRRSGRKRINRRS
jgi:hypothetical protein